MSRFALFALLGGCSLGNTLDVCKRGRPEVHEVNARTEGAQAFSGLQPGAPLPTGGSLVVFRSAVAADDDKVGPASIRAAVLDATGKPAARTCDAPGEIELVPSAPGVRNDDPSIAMPAIATATEDLGLMVYARRTAGVQEIWGVWLTTTGCVPTTFPQKTFLISDVADPNQFPSTPSVAWTGNRTFVVTWPSASIQPPFEVVSEVRMRVLRPDIGHAPLFLPTRLSPTGQSVTLGERGTFRSNGRVDRLGDGRVAVMWSQLSAVTYAPWFSIVDDTLLELSAARALATATPNPTVRKPTGRSLGATSDGAQVLLAWTGFDDNGNTRGLGRYFTLDGAPLSAPQSREGEPFVIRPEVAEDEGRLSVAPLQGGGFIVALEQLGGADGSFKSIVAAAFAATGGPRFANLACDDTSFDLVGLQGDVSQPWVFTGNDSNTTVLFTSEGVEGADKSGSGVRALSFTPRTLLPLR